MSRVVVGRIHGLIGVQGWVRVYSYTDPYDRLLAYDPWQLELNGDWQSTRVEEARRHGKGLAARLAGCHDRDAARALVGTRIAVDRAQLPPLAPDEYYWADLIGLEVVTADGTHLGRVGHLMETGANDVLVVEGDRQRLIPYVPGQVVQEVDLGSGLLRVDWDPDF